MAEFWLVPATEDNPTGLAKNDDNELIICDDCPCGCATTYEMVGTMPSNGSGWTCTITLQSGSFPCSETGTVWWRGQMVGNGPFGFLVNGNMVTVAGDPSNPTSWTCIAYGNVAGCAVDMRSFITGEGNSCPDGSYSGTGPARESTVVIS